MEKYRCGFIGAGNMATSLIGGLIADDFPPQNITVTDLDPKKCRDLNAALGVNLASTNRSLVEACDIVVLAVKPQQVRSVALEIADLVQRARPLIVSIAAGIREQSLEGWLGGNVAIVRCMPNTPALVQAGATGLHANSHVSTRQRDLAESLLRAVGVAVWVESEALLDAVTAVSGSGPAYFFLLMEAMETAALELGLPPDTARLLVEQTAFGAAKLALEADVGPGELRRRVTSPGGTTERAIETFTQGNFEQLVLQALQAAYERSKQLSAHLGENDR